MSARTVSLSKMIEQRVKDMTNKVVTYLPLDNDLSPPAFNIIPVTMQFKMVDESMHGMGHPESMLFRSVYLIGLSPCTVPDAILINIWTGFY